MTISTSYHTNTQLHRTARSSKVDAVRDTFGNKAEVVAIDDIVSGDFSEALKGRAERDSKNVLTFVLIGSTLGVDAVLHVAAPIPGKADAEGMLKVTANI